MLLDALIEALKMVTFNFAIPTVTFFNIYTICQNKMILKRNSKYNKRLIKNFKINKNSNLQELKEKINKDKVKILLPYLEELEKNTSQDNLYRVYENLKDIKVKRNMLILLSASAGTYDSSSNTIEYVLKSSLGHEFLHLASSYYNEKSGLDLSGFEQYSYVDKVLIGTGLNEGYTELLATRLYNHDKVSTHKNEVKIARLFEFFFDDKKEMEKYYFNHDLPGFINYMIQFEEKGKIIKLLLDIDTLYRLIEPMKTYYSVKIQLQLYKIFRSKCKDSPKLEEFKELVYKNKLVEMLLKEDNITKKVA